MRPVILPRRVQKYAGALALLDVVFTVYFSHELFRIYKGTHPFWSHKLAENGIWEPTKQSPRDGVKGEGDAKDAGWMNLNGVPVPASIEALNFWKKG